MLTRCVSATYAHDTYVLNYWSLFVWYAVKRLIIGDDLFGEIGEFKKNC